MLNIIIGQIGHGKMQYGLTQTVEKSHGKKVLIISNELSPEHIIKRLDRMFQYNSTISPAEILIKSEFNFADLSFANNYDIISILSYIPRVSNVSAEAAMEAFMQSLKKLNNDYPEKEIMATIQMQRNQETFHLVREKFFEADFETNENYNTIMVYRDSESDQFKIVNYHTKEVQSISKFDFFCES